MTAANVVATYTSFQGDGGNVGKGVTTDSNPTTNDYLVVCICGSSNADAMTKPDATWNEFVVTDNSIATGGGSIRAWVKKNPAASTTYTWTCSSGRTSSIGALVRGADGTTFANAVASLESAPGANHAPPAVTSTTADGLVMDFAGHRQFSPDVANWTVPASGLTWTEVADIQGADGNNNIRLALGTAVQASAGAVSTAVWTNSDIFEEAIIIRIVVTPAVTGGGSLTLSPGTADSTTYQMSGGILVPGLVSILPGRAPVDERFGSFVVAPGTALLVPGTSVSQERAGSPTLVPGSVALTPGTSASQERSGGSALAPGSVTLTPGTSVSQEQAGNAALNSGTLSLSPGSAASSERAGAPVLTTGTAIVAPGTSSSQERAGSVALSPGAVTIAPGRVDTAEAFGSVALTTGTATVVPGGIASQERVNGAAFAPGSVTLSPGSSRSSEVFGSPSIFIPITQTLSPGAIATQEVFGYAALVDGSLEPDRVPTFKIRLDRQYAEVDLTRPIIRVRLDRQVINAELEL